MEEQACYFNKFKVELVVDTEFLIGGKNYWNGLIERCSVKKYFNWILWHHFFLSDSNLNVCAQLFECALFAQMAKKWAQIFTYHFLRRVRQATTIQTSSHTSNPNSKTQHHHLALHKTYHIIKYSNWFLRRKTHEI